MTADGVAVDGPVAGPGVDPAVSRLRIIRGEPTPEELAVVAALVSAAAGGGGDGGSPEPPQRGRWNDPAATHRRAWSAGPGGWRAAAR